MISRVCPKCLIEKQRLDFGVRSKNKGIATYCKSCCIIIQREHYQIHKNKPEFMDRRRKQAQKHRQDNKNIRVTQIWHTSKNGAKRRNLEHTISRNLLHTLFEIQNWKCIKTGIPFDLTTNNGVMPFGPAIDRIDTKLGYNIGNVQIVCNVYNYAKNQFTDADVLTMATALSGKQR